MDNDAMKIAKYIAAYPHKIIVCPPVGSGKLIEWCKRREKERRYQAPKEAGK